MITKSIRVVSAIIQKNGKYLISQRREDASLPLLWEFPGGRVESGESDVDALKRELQERIGAEIDVGSPVAFRRHDYEGYSVELVLYEAELKADEIPEAKRVKSLKWIDTADLSEYPFPPADRKTIDEYQDLVKRSRGKKPQA